METAKLGKTSQTWQISLEDEQRIYLAIYIYLSILKVSVMVVHSEEYRVGFMITFT